MLRKQKIFLALWIAFWIGLLAGMVTVAPQVLSFPVVLGIIVIVFLGYVIANNLS